MKLYRFEMYTSKHREKQGQRMHHQYQASISRFLILFLSFQAQPTLCHTHSSQIRSVLISCFWSCGIILLCLSFRSMLLCYKWLHEVKSHDKLGLSWCTGFVLGKKKIKDSSSIFCLKAIGIYCFFPSYY